MLLLPGSLGWPKVALAVEVRVQVSFRGNLLEQPFALGEVRCSREVGIGNEAAQWQLILIGQDVRILVDPTGTVAQKVQDQLDGLNFGKGSLFVTNEIPNHPEGTSRVFCRDNGRNFVQVLRTVIVRHVLSVSAALPGIESAGSQ